MGKWKQAHRRWLDDDYFGDDEKNFITLPNGKKVLRDGGRMHLSMSMMDWGEEILRNTTEDMKRMQRNNKQQLGFSLADARRFGLADGREMHRPGYRYSVSDEARDAKRQAYEDYERELSMAYLLPQQNEHTGAGSCGPCETGRREGDRCLVQGQWGTLVDDGGGELICVPDDAGDTRDAATIQRDHAQTMRDEYARYEAELSEAWRGQK